MSLSRQQRKHGTQSTQRLTPRKSQREFDFLAPPPDRLLLLHLRERGLSVCLIGGQNLLTCSSQRSYLILRSGCGREGLAGVLACGREHALHTIQGPTVSHTTQSRHTKGSGEYSQSKGLPCPPASLFLFSATNQSINQPTPILYIYICRVQWTYPMNSPEPSPVTRISRGLPDRITGITPAHPPITHHKPGDTTIRREDSPYLK